MSSNNKGGILLLGVGLFLVLYNVMVFFGMDSQPRVWLFYLNMRFWSIHAAIILWVTAMWSIAESTENIMEDYLPFIRLSAFISVLLVAILALWNFFSAISSGAHEHLILGGIIAIAACCAVRSLLLFYNYRYSGEEFIDMEEAKWFWGVSSFLFVGLITLGIMYMIPIKTQVHALSDAYITESLFKSCYNGIQDLTRTGRGSFTLRIFGLLIFVAAISFVCVVGRWTLIFLSKLFRTFSKR